MMGTDWKTPFGLLLCAGGLACSLAVDVDIECKAPVDCVGRDDSEVFTCSEQGFCEVASCEIDTDCSGLGEGFEGAVCEGGSCAPPLCDDDMECREELGTDDALCEAGRCVDPKWGCIGRNDPREPEGEFASFEIQLLDPISEAPISEPTLVQACQPNDTTCDRSLPIDVSFDEEAGVLKVERMPQGFTGFLRIQGVSPGGIAYMEARFFFVRPLLNDEVAAEPAVMVTAGAAITLGRAAGEVDPPVDPERAVFLSRIHDCQGELAEGVRLVSDDPGLAEDAVLFYSNGLTPNQDLTETTTSGAAGFADILKPGDERERLIDFEAFVGGEVMTRFTINFEPNAVSHAYLYPGYE